MYSAVLLVAMSGVADVPEFHKRTSCYGSSGYVSCSGYSSASYGCSGYSGCYAASCSGWKRKHVRRSTCYSNCSAYSSCYSSSACTGTKRVGLLRRLFSRKRCSGCYTSCSGCYSGCYGYASCHGSLGYSGCHGYSGFSGCAASHAPALPVVPGCAAPLHPGTIMPPAGDPIVPGVVPGPEVGGTGEPTTPDPMKETPEPGTGEPSTPKEPIPTPNLSDLLKVDAPTKLPALVIVTLPENAILRVEGQLTRSTSTRRVFRTPALEVGQDFAYTLTVQYVRDGQPVTLSKEVRVWAGRTSEVSFGSTGVVRR